MSAPAPSVLVVPVEGEQCLAEAPVLRRRLDELVAAGHRQLELDLTDCTLLTAAALGVIDATERRLRADGGRLRLRGASGVTARVLAVTGFDRLLSAATPTPTLVATGPTTRVGP